MTAEQAEAQMRADLAARQIHYFDRADLAGATYCQINDLGLGE